MLKYKWSHIFSIVHLLKEYFNEREFFLFTGKFKEQATSNSAWLPVLNSKVPEPRPGTCVNDTSSLPDTVLNFIRSHPLMDKAVNHEHNNPVFYKRDLVFTKLVVDKWVVGDFLKPFACKRRKSFRKSMLIKVLTFNHGDRDGNFQHLDVRVLT